MSDGIMDNQTVTTSDLNAIAIDLGATSFNGFTTNKFGAAELNTITQALVSKGVLLTGNQCKPTLSLSDSKVYIQTGTIVFNSGARKTITKAVGIEKTAGTHIYAYADGITAYITAAAELPASGDYVRLAKVEESGSLTDSREFAKGKALKGVANTPVTLEKTITIYSQNNAEKQSYTFDVGFGGFNYILYTRSMGQILTCYEPIDDNTSAILYYDTETTLTITKNGTSITVSGELKGGGAQKEKTFTIILV